MRRIRIAHELGASSHLRAAWRLRRVPPSFLFSSPGEAARQEAARLAASCVHVFQRGSVLIFQLAVVTWALERVRALLRGELASAPVHFL